MRGLAAMQDAEEMSLLPCGWGIAAPTHLFYATGSFGFCHKNACGGPRLPNSSMVMSMPVLQQRHLRSRVFTGGCFLCTCKEACNACSLPRFQVLLTIP